MINVKNEIEEYRSIYSDIPKDDESAIKWIVSRIRNNTPKTNRKRLERKINRQSNGIKYEDTLDTYYVQMINDTLSEIKQGHKSYLFSFDHIKEILSFYPTAKFIDKKRGITCLEYSFTLPHLILLRG